VESVLNRQRLERRQREQERDLRNQQDAAYQASLARDREKTRQAEERRQEEERKREQELTEVRREQERLQRMADRREECRRRLKPEPDLTTDGTVVTLAVRLPDGRRVDRRFLASDSVAVLYDFIGQFDLGPECERFVCCLSFPRRPLNDHQLTLGQVGLAPRGVVVVEEVYSED
jgi:FAS-associated factor 2